MIEKTIKFKDLEGNEVTKTFHFHMSIDDALELEFWKKGGLKDYVDKAVQDEDNRAIYRLFKNMIQKSYGVKHEDGIQFVKSKKLTRTFIQSDAFSEFIIELVSDPKKAIEFFNALVPKEAVDRMAANAESARSEAKSYTRAELLTMTDEEFDKVAGTNPAKMSKDHLVVAMERKNR